MNAIMPGDQILIRAKQFIENNMHDKFLTDDIRTKFAEYYESLTPHNALAVFEEVHRMHHCANLAFARQNAITMFYHIFLFGLILVLFRVISKNYVSKNTRVSNILGGVYILGLIGVFVAFSIFLITILMIFDDKRCIVQV